jgi:hypothetical protein
MKRKTVSDAPDLHTQLESLFDQVWESEADWRLWDRVDALVLIETLRAKRAASSARDAEPDVGSCDYAA